MSWRAGNAESHGTRVVTDTGGSVAWVPTVSSSEKSHCVSPEEAHRRAVLMSASEDLLEALEGLMALESRGRIMPIGSEWDAARAAIAKATGEQK